MTEIVPPKLNKDSGMFSLFINRRNIVIAIGILISLLLWANIPDLTIDQKIFIEVIIAGLLIPFLFNVYGRPFHILLIDTFNYLTNSKNKRILLARDISEGILIISDTHFAKVYRLQALNLLLASEEEIYSFKRYLQSALFSLKNSIQILTVEQYSINDENLQIERSRIKNLDGTVKERAIEYLEDYGQLTSTMERKFYLVLTLYAKNIHEAKRLFEEQENSLIKLIEQARVPVIPLTTSEVLELSNYILPMDHEYS